jgi:hypothetical protein
LKPRAREELDLRRRVYLGEIDAATLKRARSVLDAHGGNMLAAVRTLGMPRATLIRPLRHAGRVR